MKKFLVVNDDTGERTELDLDSLCAMLEDFGLDEFSVEVIEAWGRQAKPGESENTCPYAPFFIMCL
jgi:hypothetical protein